MVSIQDSDMSAISVNEHEGPLWNPRRGFFYTHDTRQTELPGDDGAMRQHAASLDHQATDQREDGSPSRISLARHQNVAALEQVRVRDAFKHGGTCCNVPATGGISEHLFSACRRFTIRTDCFRGAVVT